VCRSARSLASSYTPTLGSYNVVGSHGGSYLGSHDQHSGSYLLAPNSLSALPSEPVQRGEACKSSPGSSILRMVKPLLPMLNIALCFGPCSTFCLCCWLLSFWLTSVALLLPGSIGRDAGGGVRGVEFANGSIKGLGSHGSR
jgi:hypothetical protein